MCCSVISATDLILRLIEHEVPKYGLVHLLDLPEERLEIIELEVGDSPGLLPSDNSSLRHCTEQRNDGNWPAT